MRFFLGFIGGLGNAALILIIVNLAERWPYLWIPIGFHSIVMYAVLHPARGWLCPLISTFSTDKNEVWITIDDGPDPKENPAMLDLLDRYDAKATFFVIGDRLAKNPEIGKNIVQRGHGLGNHTWSHPRWVFWSYMNWQIKREIRQCSDQIEEITGTRPLHFRPPVGHTPWGLKPVLAAEKLSYIFWSTRAQDGLHYDHKRCLDQLIKGIKPGAILLLHEGCGHGPELLESLLEELKGRGYQAVLPKNLDLNHNS